MLAVVFWNSRNAGATDSQYEEALSGFHEELNRHKPEGFRRSVCSKVATDLPWLGSEYPVYEDWYIMTNFAALDDMDRLVTDDKHLPAHRALMQRTGCASGAVVYLEEGTPFVERSKFAYWFSKSKDDSTSPVDAIANAAEPAHSTSVWTRAMALGPVGNCLLTDERAVLPSACKPVEIIRDVVWSP